MTVTAEAARIVCFLADRQSQPIEPNGETMGLVRELRAVSAELRIGPWWLLELSMTRDGRVEIAYDYGDEQFPKHQLFAPEAYYADLKVFPRNSVPAWLTGYISPAAAIGSGRSSTGRRYDRRVFSTVR